MQPHYKLIKFRYAFGDVYAYIMWHYIAQVIILINFQLILDMYLFTGVCMNVYVCATINIPRVIYVFTMHKYIYIFNSEDLHSEKKVVTSQ